MLLLQQLPIQSRNSTGISSRRVKAGGRQRSRFGWTWHLQKDCGSFTWSAFDSQRSPKHFGTFTHPDRPKVTGIEKIGRKAHTIIFNDDAYIIPSTLE